MNSMPASKEFAKMEPAVLIMARDINAFALMDSPERTVNKVFLTANKIVVHQLQLVLTLRMDSIVNARLT